ncbi:MAG: hypothetical protein HFI86_02820 [Bacilli bacterium]|nr:hypothetical protein [Bacilli bacterium]MCI9434198.1 hypothetical protein [Bacilli bacterium]
MLSKLKSSKQLKILYLLLSYVIFCIFCLPIFEILIEIISKAGRIVGTYIRLIC